MNVMNTRMILGLVLLFGGLVWVAFGIHATDAPLEKFVEAFTGSYSDKTQWSLIGGAAIAAAGAAFVFGSAVRR